MADEMPTAPPVKPIAQKTFVDVLLAKNILTPEQIDQFSGQAQTTGRNVADVIEESKIIKDDEIAKAKSEAFGIEFADLFGRVISPNVLKLIPQELSDNYKIIPFDQAEGAVHIAMVNPGDYKAVEAVEYLARERGFTPRYFVVTTANFKYLFRQYESLSSEVEEALKGAVTEGVGEKTELQIEEKGLEEVVKSAPVSKMVSVIVQHAVEGKASDVHIEPMAGETRVRYRIDGILYTSLILPKYVHSSIVARIKVMSNLKIDETRVPQDGRFRMSLDNRDVDFRVSTLPVVGNEKVVMRILDTTTNILDLEKLGYWGRGLELIRRNIEKSHGMLLITGPTGSGKSTTLYAILTILNAEAVNIVTLEDPVEYYVKGINQSQINPEVGLTFAAGLRSILRQDPDIIMVGEIRDTETAELAIHAALTGHIVLSTLHTNDAFGAVPRLIDMEIEPFLLVSSLNVVIAQRLVRRICPHCVETFKPVDKVQEEIAAILAISPHDVIPKDINLKKPFTCSRGKGCARCEHTGYKGRMAIAEVFEMTENLKKIIQAGNDLDQVKDEFRKQGVLTMKQDGIVKVLQGQTTIEEVWNVTRE